MAQIAGDLRRTKDVITPGYREDNEDDSGSAGEMQQQAGEFSLEETVKV